MTWWNWFWDHASDDIGKWLFEFDVEKTRRRDAKRFLKYGGELLAIGYVDEAEVQLGMACRIFPEIISSLSKSERRRLTEELNTHTGGPNAAKLRALLSGRTNISTIEWFKVWFDDEKVYMTAQPPNQEPWAQDFRWIDIKQICYQAEGLWFSDGIYVFTKSRPESYVIPTEAIGGLRLWNEIIDRGIFDAKLAISAATATEGQFWWPP
jgi:hypothetical protein